MSWFCRILDDLPAAVTFDVSEWHGNKTKIAVNALPVGWKEYGYATEVPVGWKDYGYATEVVLFIFSCYLILKKCFVTSC